AYGSKAMLGIPNGNTALANQFDVVADTSPSAVSNSQWHYGTDVHANAKEKSMNKCNRPGASKGRSNFKWIGWLAPLLGATLLLGACASSPRAAQPTERQATAQAIFAERCKGAGEKIFK